MTAKILPVLRVLRVSSRGRKLSLVEQKNLVLPSSPAPPLNASNIHVNVDIACFHIEVSAAEYCMYGRRLVNTLVCVARDNAEWVSAITSNVG